MSTATRPDPVAVKIVASIWRDLSDRRGFDLGCLDQEIQDDIYETWLEKVSKLLKKKRKAKK